MSRVVYESGGVTVSTHAGPGGAPWVQLTDAAGGFAQFPRELCAGLALALAQLELEQPDGRKPRQPVAGS